MATKTKGSGKASSNGHAPVLEPGGAAVKLIALSAINGNSAQARGMGVLSTLQDMGYGVFERGSDEDKKPLWEMLWSNDPAERKEVLGLLQEHEKDFVEWANSFNRMGQLQPIGVRVIDGGGYDVIYGMRRVLAAACAHVRDNSKPAEIEAKVYPSDIDALQLKYMSLDENEQREDESPIDRAMTYQWLQKVGKQTPEQIAARAHRSLQSVRDHLKLLSPLIEDVRMKVHLRQKSMESALALWDKRRKTDKEVKGEDGDSKGGKERFRIPTTKGLIKMYDLKRKPKKVPQEEWDLFTKPDVRAWLAYKLGLKYEEYVEEPEPEPEVKAPKGKVLRVKKPKAIHLLISLGKTNARTWSDDKIKESLENIVAIQESPEQTVETPRLQQLLDKLREGYAATPQLKVEIVPGDEK